MENINIQSKSTLPSLLDPKNIMPKKLCILIIFWIILNIILTIFLLFPVIRMGLWMIPRMFFQNLPVSSLDYSLILSILLIIIPEALFICFTVYYIVLLRGNKISWPLRVIPIMACFIIAALAYIMSIGLTQTGILFSIYLILWISTLIILRRVDIKSYFQHNELASMNIFRSILLALAKVVLFVVIVIFVFIVSNFLGFKYVWGGERAEGPADCNWYAVHYGVYNSYLKINLPVYNDTYQGECYSMFPVFPPVSR